MQNQQPEVKDGIALMYIKDGVMYPTALTEEQHTMLTLFVSSVCQPLTVITTHPQGSAVNLVGGKK